MRRWILPLLPLLLVSTACKDGPQTTSGATWHGDVRPLVERTCTQSCHEPGGIGPIDFTTPVGAEAPPWAAAAAAAVAAGTMPPWLPDDDCYPIQGARTLSDEERALFQSWADAEFPVGDEAEFSPIQMPPDPMEDRRPDFGQPNLELAAPEPYRPSTAQPDDYRCIVLPEAFDADTWVRGMEVVPDKGEILHHIILYMYHPSQDDEIEDMLERDADEDGPGYTCFENPNAETVAAWAPGQKAEFLPDGVARYVPAGARWFLQIHYNTLGKDPSEVPADQTTLMLWTTPQAPPQALLTLAFANFDIAIPAGDPKVAEKADTSASYWFGPFPGSFPVVGVMAHMHQLGSAFNIDYQANGSGRKECLLDIPRWDFNWQQTYFFPEDQPLMASQDTRFHMTCTYDNSPGNQQVINGEPLEPRDVYWGENTTDEMCLSYFFTQIPSAFVQ